MWNYSALFTEQNLHPNSFFFFFFFFFFKGEWVGFLLFMYTKLKWLSVLYFSVYSPRDLRRKGEGKGAIISQPPPPPTFGEFQAAQKVPLTIIPQSGGE